MLQYTFKSKLTCTCITIDSRPIMLAQTETSRSKCLCNLAFSDIFVETPRPDCFKKEPKADDEGKFNSKSLRLNNNNIVSFSEIIPTLQKLVLEPLELSWIDLSFNEIVKIDIVSL